MVIFFYVQDVRKEHRLFSSEPPAVVAVKKSRAKEAWELARKKLTLLPQRTLRQEQAFARALRIPDPSVRVLHGSADAKWLNARFRFFLLRQRTKRLFLLIGELLLVPVTGLLVPIPGPNIAFYALALLIITHWESFRGIRCLLQKEPAYEKSPLLEAWEKAVEEKREADYPELLRRIESKFGIPAVQKILGK